MAMNLERELDSLKERLIKRYKCPCCDNFTIRQGSYWQECPVCGWVYEEYREDEMFVSVVEDSEEQEVLTLDEARANYRRIGAVTENHTQYVRKPNDLEKGSYITKSGQEKKRTRRNHIGILPRVWYGPILFLLAGILMILFGVMLVTTSLAYQRDIASTTGEIVSSRLVHDWPEVINGNDPYYTRMVMVEFSVQGFPQPFRFEVGTDKLVVGQQVEIRYDPSNPKRAEIRGWHTPWFPSSLLLVIGVICLVVGTCWLIV